MKAKANRPFGRVSGLRLWLGTIGIICFQILGAQGYELSFGGTKEDQGRTVVQTADQGFLQVGFSESFGSDNDVDIFLVRTDVDGSVLWTKVIDEGFEEQAFDAISQADGSSIIVGYRQPEFGDPTQVYLLSVDKRGERLWSKTYQTTGLNDRGYSLTAAPDGGFLITGTSQSPVTQRDDILLLKVDANGEEEWREIYGTSRTDIGVGAVALEDGYIFAANMQGTSGPDMDIALYRVNSEGGLIWVRVYGTANENEEVNEIIPTQDGNIAWVGSTSNFNKALVAKTDLNGDTLFYREFDTSPFEDYLLGVLEEADGSLVAVGSTGPTASNLAVLLLKVAPDGQPVWHRRLGSAQSLNTGDDIAATIDGGYVITGYNALFGAFINDMVLFTVSGEGDYLNNQLSGRVFASADGCNPYTDGDQLLEGWLVRAQNETATFFGTTDANGRYNMRVDRGSYTVTLLRKNDYWEICNPVALIVDFDQPYDTTNYDFPVTAKELCPSLQVNIESGLLRACSEAIYTINYANYGTDTAYQASVELTLDDELTFSDAERIPRMISEKVLAFDLGDLPPGATGQFRMRADVACTGVLPGQAVSLKAHITPDTLCGPVDPDWDGSSVEVSAECVDGNVQLRVRNVGQQPMQTEQSYIVVEDQIMFRTGKFQLDVQEDKLVEVFPASSATYRIVAKQSEGHPGNSYPTVAVEGCSQSGSYSTGQVTQFPENDGDPFIDIAVQEIIDTDETLVLQGHPKGYLDSIVSPQTDLEYTLFFVNSGVDTVDRIVIRDTLPPALDVRTLEMGSASHPYVFEVYNNGILKITFDSIQLLPGSGANETTSGGFINFRLSQKPDLPLGTVIENRAAVFFDYVEPASTNVVRHVVGCGDFFTSGCLISSTTDPDVFAGAIITVFPNPFSETARLRIEDCAACNGEMTFTLYDVLGKPVRVEQFRGNEWTLSRQGLPSALYFYELRSNGSRISNGRLFVQ